MIYIDFSSNSCRENVTLAFMDSRQWCLKYWFLAWRCGCHDLLSQLQFCYRIALDWFCLTLHLYKSTIWTLNHINFILLCFAFLLIVHIRVSNYTTSYKLSLLCSLFDLGEVTIQLCSRGVVVHFSETNLKVRQALTVTADMIDIEQLSRFNGYYSDCNYVVNIQAVHSTLQSEWMLFQSVCVIDYVCFYVNLINKIRCKD